MGSREAIAAEKGALAEAIEPQGTVILNADDPFSEGIAARTRAKVVLAGTTGGACGRSKFARVPTAQSSQLSRARIVAAHSFPLRVRTWCRMHCWPSPPGGHLDYPSRNVPRPCRSPAHESALANQGDRWRAISGRQLQCQPDSMKAALRTLVELGAEGKRIAVLGRNARTRH
jgi:UDP-N-acetylmuramyl pentapeptide synthase